MIRREFVLLGTGLIALPFLYSFNVLSAPFPWRLAPAHSKQPQADGPVGVLTATAAAQVVTTAQQEAQRIKSLAQNPQALQQECQKTLPQLRDRLDQLNKRVSALNAASTAEERKELAAWLILAADSALLLLGLSLPITAPAAILAAVFLPTTKLAIQFFLTDHDMNDGAALIAKYEGSRIVYFGKLIKASTPGATTPAGYFQRFGGAFFSCLSLAYSAYSAYTANAQSSIEKQQLAQAKNFSSEFFGCLRKYFRKLQYADGGTSACGR